MASGKRFICGLAVSALAVLGPHAVGATETVISFPGNIGYVDLGTPGALYLGTNAPFTFEGWVYLDAVDSRDVLFSKNNGRADSPYSLLLGFIDSGSMAVYPGTGSWLKPSPAAMIAIKRWYHFAFSSDGTNVSYYLDGLCKGASTLSFKDDPAHTIKLGGYNNSGSDFKGRMSDVRLWNYGRGAEEIAADMGRRLIGTETGLLGYWRLDEGVGSNATDRTAGGSDGGITNGTWSVAADLVLLLSDDTLTVTASPGEYGVPEPPYGITNDVPPGTGFTCSAPAIAALDTGLRGVCAGYALYTNDVFAATDTTNAFSYTQTVRGTLVWQWQRQWELTFLAGAGGSVNHGGGWYDEGSAATVTAQPAAGYRFHYWSGDVPEGEALNATATVPATQARAMQANFIAEGTGGEKIYSGPVGGLWHEASNWTPPGVPGIGDSVVITNAGGRVILNALTAPLAACVVSNTATLLFTNWTTALLADEVVIGDKAVVTCAGPFANPPAMPSRVWIACSNLTVTGKARIDVDAKGFLGGNGPGTGVVAYAGGSYGGRTGYGAGETYGAAAAPADPGSGGRSATGGTCAGGGAVRLAATGLVTVDGVITANGANGAYGHGCGSGGAVYITCSRFSGTGGKISANGGFYNGTYSGGGGGGRVAVVYDPAAQQALPVPDVAFEAGGGQATWGYGDLGTLYFPDSRWLRSPLLHKGQWLAPELNGWELDTLLVSNGWVRFPAAGFQLTVTNDAVMTGSDPLQFGLQLRGGRLDCGGSLALRRSGLTLFDADGAPSALTVGGDLVLTNAGGATSGGHLSVYAAATNDAGGAGATVTVGGRIVISPYSAVFPYAHATNGAVVTFAAGDLLLMANGKIDADGKGYARQLGPGGPRFASGTGYWGGSYGGLQGYANATNGPYGSHRAPAEPGSGGVFGVGGGAVQFAVTDAAILDGTITANGGAGDYWAGGGSGGSVYITCTTLSGNGGVITVNGGNGTVPGASAGGGGGRISIPYDPVAQDTLPLPRIVFSAAGGRAGGGYGHLGTLYFSDNRFLTPVFPHKGQWTADGSGQWAFDTFTLTNAWLRFPDADTVLTVTNDLVITGSDAQWFGLQMTNGMLACGGNMLVKQSGLTLYGGEAAVAGDLVLDHAGGATAGSRMTLFPAVTNAASPDYGARVRVGGELYVSPYSTIYPWAHRINGSTARFEVRDLTVAANGAIDANYMGFAAKLGPGTSADYRIGPSHGGCGGNNPGGTYGSSNAPAYPGSGGNWFVGGGAVRVFASNRITVDGTITANGQNGDYWNSGGSGGSVHLVGKRFAGAAGGQIRANAGNGAQASAAGGGGRIAVWRRFHEAVPELTANVTATGGTGAYPSEKGTVVWGWLVSPGTVLLLR